ASLQACMKHSSLDCHPDRRVLRRAEGPWFFSASDKMTRSSDLFTVVIPSEAEDGAGLQACLQHSQLHCHPERGALRRAEGPWFFHPPMKSPDHPNLCTA